VTFCTIYEVYSFSILKIRVERSPSITKLAHQSAPHLSQVPTELLESFPAIRVVPGTSTQLSPTNYENLRENNPELVDNRLFHIEIDGQRDILDTLRLHKNASLDTGSFSDFTTKCIDKHVSSSEEPTTHTTPADRQDST
jgi:hypothetical protein